MLSTIRKLVSLSVLEGEEFEEKVASGMKYMSHAQHPVQSRGELRIANYLFDLGVPYIYDTLIKINGHMVRPDFILPEHHLILEFKGMDTRDYNIKFKRKFDIYTSSDFEVMVIHPEGLDQFEQLGLFVNA